MLKFLLFLLVQALLYYVACHLLARKSERVPGLMRLIFTVFFIVAISGFLRWALGYGWMTQVIVLVTSFFILWGGLGLGPLRTLIAALIVFLLNLALSRVFEGGHFPSSWVSLGLFPLISRRFLFLQQE